MSFKAKILILCSYCECMAWALSATLCQREFQLHVLDAVHIPSFIIDLAGLVPLQITLEYDSLIFPLSCTTL